MPIILDIYGVIFINNQINKPLLMVTDQYRKNGHKIYLASNVEKEKRDFFMKECQLCDHAEALFCSGELNTAKPNWLFYDKVTKAVDANPEDIIFFDDSAVNVDHARNYGWQAFVYQDIQQVKNEINIFLKTKEKQNVIS